MVVKYTYGPPRVIQNPAGFIVSFLVVFNGYCYAVLRGTFGILLSDHVPSLLIRCVFIALCLSFNYPLGYSVSAID